MPRRVDPDDRDPIAVAFGAAVRAARLGREETLEDVAGRIPRTNRTGQRISMDGRTLGEIERGYHAPTITTAKQIADALEVSLMELTRKL